MCGLVGFIDPLQQLSTDARRTNLAAMTAAIQHRGPDADGHWLSNAYPIALGHRRLSILDLTEAGTQPMQSSDGRYVLVYNGEIYNHQKLRSELQNSGVSFTSQTDTETLLQALIHWGAKKTLKRINGMFAFAFWDQHTNQLTLARDRLGIKPLYYGWQNNIFYFSSELKALTQHQLFQKQLNPSAIAAFLYHAYIPAPQSIYQTINKLVPGSYLTINPNLTTDELTPIIYWQTSELYQQVIANQSEQQLQAEFESLLNDAVKIRMMADVPLGAFLSGGIDSSLVVATMQQHSSRPVKTFSIGFDVPGFNEAPHAKAVAQHLGTDHTELYLNAQQAIDIIPSLSQYYDEPFADASQIPTLLLSQLTRQHVTVSLSGDGGDELYAGYNRYLWANQLWRKLAWLPKPMRSLLSKLLLHYKTNTWDNAYHLVKPLLLGHLAMQHPGEKAHKLGRMLNANNSQAVYASLIAYWHNPDSIFNRAVYDSSAFKHIQHWPAPRNAVESYMYLDLLSYLPDDILVKVDRASMAFSLEARVPLLDHRLVEFAWRLPMEQKIKNKQGKYILRQQLYKSVPRELIERPKMGFGVPLDDWLRDEGLKQWAGDLLSLSQLKRHDYLNPQPILQLWEQHCQRQGNWANLLWPVLMLLDWLKFNGID